MIIDVGAIAGVIGSLAVCGLIIVCMVVGFKQNSKTHGSSGKSGPSSSTSTSQSTSSNSESK